MKNYCFILVLVVFVFSIKQQVLAQTTVTAQTIIDDMTLAPDAALHGVPSNYSWGDGKASQQPMPVPAKNNKGQWWRAMTTWGQAYIPVQGSTASNTRMQIRNMVTKLLYKNGKWHEVQHGDPQGAAFVEDFANNASIGAGERNESANGGGKSVIVGVGKWAGHNYHFWPMGSRAVVDVDSVIGVYNSCEARLIVDNPNLPDDRDVCKNVLQVGADWWLDLKVDWLPDWSANSGIGGCRSKWVTSEWQSFNFCTLLPEDIRKNPPIGEPIALIKVTGVALDSAVFHIFKGEPVKLNYTLSPADATDKYVAWKSSNTNIAAIDAFGVVTGLADGTATITVTTDDGAFTATCEIKVISSGFTVVNVGNDKDGITKVGGWDFERTGDFNNDERMMNGKGNYCEYSFTGTGIDVLGFLPGSNTYDANYEIKVDEISVATGTTNSPTEKFMAVLGSARGLSNTLHKVRVEFTAAIGSSPFVIIDAFKVYSFPTSANSIVQEKSAQLMVYPNPSTSGLINICVNGLSEDALLNIYTTKGQIVYSEFLTIDKTAYIIQEAFKPGIYLIRVFGKELNETKKLFVK